MPVRPLAERMPSASTLPAVVSTSRIAASPTPGPRPPAQAGAIELFWFAPWLDGSGTCEPDSEPAATPKARRMLAPSTVISAGCTLAPRNVGCAESAEALAAGVSCRNSCQRRPLIGSDCNCAALMVVVTAAAAGSGFCEAETIGPRCERLCSIAVCVLPAAAAVRSMEGSRRAGSESLCSGSAMAGRGSSCADSVSSSARGAAFCTCIAGCDGARIGVCAGGSCRKLGACALAVRGAFGGEFHKGSADEGGAEAASCMGGTAETLCCCSRLL
jgi:hypothetical protein